MDFEDLKDTGLQEKLKTCTNAEDLAELIKNEGIDITEDDLKNIAGGYEAWDFSGY